MAAETDAPEDVLFKGFPLRTWADLQGGDAAFEVHPLAALGAGGDSNPRQGSSSSGDRWGEGTVGLRARALGSEGGCLTLDLELGRRLYAETSDRNATTYAASATAIRRGSSAQGQLAASWVRDDAPVREFPESALRDQQDASAIGNLDFRRWRLSGGLTLTRVDFLESTPHFNEVNEDTLHAGASIEPALLGADKSQLGLRLSAGQTMRPSGADRAGGWDAAAEAHWIHAVADRSTLELFAGGQMRAYRAVTSGDPENDDDRVAAASLRAALTWPWEEGSQLVVRAGRGLEDGVSANAAAAIDASVEVRVRLADRWSATATAARWLTEDSGASSPSGPEHINGRHFRVATQYLLREGLGVRVFADYSAIEAVVSDSWQRWFTGVEVAVSL